MEKELIMQKANIERAFVATVMEALVYYIDNMIDYCNKNSIRIDSFEKSQLYIMKKAAKNITIEYKTLPMPKSKAFKDFSKCIAVTLQELFSKTDGDSLKMYQFYNYIKAFPTKRREIEVHAEIERDAFDFVFNTQNNKDNENNTTQS